MTPRTLRQPLPDGRGSVQALPPSPGNSTVESTDSVAAPGATWSPASTWAPGEVVRMLRADKLRGGSIIMKQWQQFFDGYATKYDDEVFTHNTDAELRFIVEHMRPPAGARILDIGCGTGRHSVGLAALGYRVTGVDMSSGMLEQARKRAESVGAVVEWVHCDATTFEHPEEFDLAISLCEGAMCLVEPGEDVIEHDELILRNICAALCPGGRLLLNVLNGCRQLRLYNSEGVESGQYDIMDMTEASDDAICPPGTPISERVREHGYTPPEIRRALRTAGFEVRGVFGGTAGHWNLAPPQLDEMELMIFADKPTG